jgi:WD40 repeat protein
MASDPPKVLISYSHDSPEHARRVLGLANRLRADGIDCTIDQYVVTPAEGWPRWMDKQIRDSDFVLMVCTETYYQRAMGEDQPGKGRGVRWEGSLIYQYIYDADSINTKFIPVLFDSCSSSHIPAPLRSTTFYYVHETGGYDEDLYRRLTHQPSTIKPELGTLRSLAPTERKSEGSVGRLVNVPDLPPHFLPRLGDLQELKDAMLAGLTKPLALTGAGKIGVQGMGGIGKTVLATALAHDSEVRQAFPDGIYWLTVGQKPNLLDLQNRLFHQLTGSKETLTTEQEAKDALRKALEGKAALLVVDDAWTIDHADAFSATPPPARLLITTRNNEVLVGLGAEEHRVDVLSTRDALKMLAEWLGEKSSDKLPPEAAEVAKECGCLPLALAMIGAMVRLSSRPTAWKDALTRLQRADLGAIKRAFPGYPYPDLLRGIDVSVEALEPTDKERYLDLAVFPEDLPIPEGTLGVLWNRDEIDTRDCMVGFVGRSLATWATGESALVLHDLQRDFVHKRREKELPGLHLRLVETWDALLKLPDPYAWRWIAYHLVQAGHKDDLHQLLLNFNYLEAKLVAADTNALIADYDYFAEDEDLRMIQSALRLSTHVLARDPRQLAGQVTGRLLSNTAPSIQALLKQAAVRKVWPWLRPLKPSLTAPGGSLICTLEGHTDSVRAMAVTPDGCRVVSASDDRTLRLWDLGTGQTIRTLEGHTDSVWAVAVTPDGRRAVSASADRTLRLWDLDSGKQIGAPLQGHTGSVYAVAVTPDGRWAVSGLDDGMVRLWDLGTGKTLRTFEGHTREVNAVAVTPDGHRAVSASYDRMLRLWDLDTGQTLRTLEGHTYGVNAVAVTPDGRRALSGSNDRTLRLWDLGTGQILLTLEGQDSVRAVAVTPDGRRALSAAWDDRTLRLWDLGTGQTLRTLEGHTGNVRAVAVTPDGRSAVSGSEDHTLRVWDLGTGQTLRTLEGHTDWVYAVAVTPDGRRAVSASASDDGTVRLWNLGTGQTLRTLEGHTGSVRAVAVTPDGRRAVSASDDQTLRVWDLESGQTLRTLEYHTHTHGVMAVAITPDGRRAVSASSHDRALQLWDLGTGQILRTLEGHTNSVMAPVTVTPDGRRALLALDDGTVQLWDLGTGQTLRTLEGHTDGVNAVAVTPDGRRALSASHDRTLRLWDLETGQTLRTLEGHTGGVWAVAVTPDGRRAVSGSDDRTLRLWDLESGQILYALEGHTGMVWAVALTPDGRRALSASHDQTLRLWDLKSGKEIATFTGESGMRSCTIAPDGRTVIAYNVLGRVHLLQLVEVDPSKSAIGETKIQLLRLKGQATI